MNIVNSVVTIGKTLEVTPNNQPLIHNELTNFYTKLNWCPNFWITFKGEYCVPSIDLHLGITDF
jgi:hypothetical protein